MKVHGLADKVKYEIKIDWLRMDIRGYQPSISQFPEYSQLF